MSKFLIDTNVILDIRNRKDSDHIYKKLTEMVSAGALTTVRQVITELRYEEDKDVRHFVDSSLKLSVDNNLAYAATVASKMQSVLQGVPKLINLTGGTAGDPADPWLVAVASVYGWSVITNENPRSPNRIPAACNLPDIQVNCIRGPEFLLGQKIVTTVDYAHVDPKGFFGT